MGNSKLFKKFLVGAGMGPGEKMFSPRRNTDHKKSWGIDGKKI